MAKLTALAKIAKAATKGGGDLATLIEAAEAIVTAANVLLKEAKPILDTIDTEALAAKAKAGAQVAAEGAGKAGEAAKGAAGSATDAIADMFSKLGDARNGLLEDLAQAKSEKELKNAIKDARQSVLENATTTMTLSEYVKVKEKTKSSSGPFGPISDMPGCFVIATYRKMDFDKDLTDYTGIYVGSADNAAEGVARAMSKAGDADVYADVKFKQNVHIYIFNCMPDDLEHRYDSLIQTFADERSYN